jgi:hypothetical protein
MKPCRIAALLLLAGLSGVAAAPAIPSSELPGRDRQRFLESPLDRFMQPSQKAEPLWRWQCDQRTPRRGKQRSKRNKAC